ncbi:MAG: PepSY-associated TM helix domain-containing protein [Bacteroidales bacterium]
MDIKQQASLLRTTRKIHRFFAASLFILFLFIAVTGILLGWKKNVDTLLPESRTGTSINTADWLSFDSLRAVAFETLRDSAGSHISIELNRIDARPSSGMVKFVFKDHYWEVQLDAATAKVLNVSQRKSDIIENIHDGSIIDYALKTESGIFKLIYTTIIGLALLTFTLTGIWLWYGPKLIRNTKKRKNGKRQNGDDK